MAMFWDGTKFIVTLSFPHDSELALLDFAQERSLPPSDQPELIKTLLNGRFFLPQVTLLVQLFNQFAFLETP